MLPLSRILAGSSHDPVVYFLRNGSRVKIGTTRNLRRRVESLSLALSDVALVMLGSFDVEAEMHARYAPYRVSGDREWFDVWGELRTLLESAPAPVPVPVPIPVDPSLCSLRQAARDTGSGIVPLGLAALRKRRARAGATFPEGTDVDGTLYFVADDLAMWWQSAANA